MNDRVNGNGWHIPVLVALFGGVGGLTAWVWSITVGTPMKMGTTGAVAANVFLGMVAGFAGIYAIKLDSTRVLLHSLALALLCGFAWKPTLEAGRELVITRMQEGDVEQQIELTQQTIEALETASPEKAAIYIEELESRSLELMRSGDAVRNPALRAQANGIVVESVGALSDAASVAPEAGARALGSVGAAAMREDRPAITNAAASSLIHLAEEKDFEIGTSAEVSNSLLQLSAAARAGQREDKAGALREQSVEIFRQAERRLPPDDRDRFRELRERSIVTHEEPPPER